MYRRRKFRRSFGGFPIDTMLYVGDWFGYHLDRWGEVIDGPMNRFWDWLENSRLIKRFGRMIGREKVAWWAYIGPAVIVASIFWLVMAPAIFTAAYGDPIHLMGMGEHALSDIYLLISVVTFCAGVAVTYLGGLIRKLERETHRLIGVYDSENGQN